jgi:O-antigen/teichoic acid export membrane protein
MNLYELKPPAVDVMTNRRTSFLHLLGSAYATQLIPILVLPATTRLYMPADFGDLLLFVSWYTFAGTLGTAKYETTILVVEDDELWALARIVAALVMLFATTFILGITVVARYTPLLHALTHDSESVALMFIAVVGFSANLLLTGWNNRCGNYRKIAFARLAQSSLTSLMPIAIYFANGPIEHALLTSQVSGLVGAVLVLCLGSHPKLRPAAASRATVWATVKKYSKNSLYGLPHAMIDNALPLVLASTIGHWYGRTELGWYNIALKFKMPFTAAANSFGMLYHEAVHRRLNSSRDSAEANIKRATLFGTILCPLLLFAPLICRFILGPGWAPAGYYVLLSSPMFVLSYLVGTFGATGYLLNRQRTAFRYGLAFNVAQVLPFLAVAVYTNPGKWPIEYAIALSSGLCALVLVFHLRWLARLQYSA